MEKPMDALQYLKQLEEDQDPEVTTVAVIGMPTIAAVCLLGLAVIGAWHVVYHVVVTLWP